MKMGTCSLWNDTYREKPKYLGMTVKPMLVSFCPSQILTGTGQTSIPGVWHPRWEAGNKPSEP